MVYQTLEPSYSTELLNAFINETLAFPDGFKYNGLSGKHELYIYAGGGEYYPFVEISSRELDGSFQEEMTVEYKDFILLDFFNSRKNFELLASRYKELNWIMFWAEYLHWQDAENTHNAYSRNPYDYIWLLEQNVSIDEKLHLLSCGVYKQADGEMFKDIPEVFWTPLMDKADVLKTQSMKKPIRLFC
jgi:hypothetical protein